MKKRFFLVFKLRNFIICVLIGVLAFSASYCLDIFSEKAVNTYLTDSEEKLIIIDAGHGGQDGGTQSQNGNLEKDINLAISLKLKDLFTLIGIRNISVREGDYLIHDNSAKTIRERKVSDIKARIQMMKDNPDSIFLSIHQNYFTQSKYYGAQVFYSPNDRLSPLIAESLQQSITEKLQPDNARQTKKIGKEVYLLYNAFVPSVMVECGFLSNEKEAQLLQQESYQMKMAIAITNGILKFI